MQLLQERQPYFEDVIRQNPIVNNNRISLNHSMMCALVEALGLVIKVSPTKVRLTLDYLKSMAASREQVCGSDHPLVQEFWEIYDFLEGDNDKVVNHSRDPQYIAINLNQFAEEATNRKQKLPLLNELKSLLKDCRIHKFVGRKPVNSAVNAHLNKKHPSMNKPLTVKCWVFQAN